MPAVLAHSRHPNQTVNTLKGVHSMTDTNVSTTNPEIIRNGFEVITREALFHTLNIAMGQLDKARSMTAAIGHTAGMSPEIARVLAAQATLILDGAHNDIDCLSECAAKAGITGEMVAVGKAPASSISEDQRLKAEIDPQSPAEMILSHMGAVDDLIQRVGDKDGIDSITKEIFKTIDGVIGQAIHWLEKYDPKVDLPGDYHADIDSCFCKMQVVCSLFARGENGEIDIHAIFRIFFDEIAEVTRIVNLLEGKSDSDMEDAA
jgi:hypothetical protein